ncbi:hypothetical protein [Haloparvum sp. PAK95]|uniref:hypothetical protein n=1 Tax=Haloparvum sp. PAK95 TaxID=3418962 RepID=UPI003D2F4940
MFDRKPNRLGYAVIVGSGVAVALAGMHLLDASALASRLFWGLLVPSIVLLDATLEFLLGVRVEYYLVAVLVVATGFLAFLVFVLPGMVEPDSPEVSRRR